MLHDETVKMIRPPSEKKRQAIDNLIVEAVSTENRQTAEKTSSGYIWLESTCDQILFQLLYKPLQRQ